MDTSNIKNYFGIIAIILIAASTIAFIDRYQSDDSQGQQDRQGIKTFSSEISGLPAATDSQTVELQDGDTYELIAHMVKKDINGQEVKMLAYNGSIPGPLIKVPQNAEIIVKLTNNTDVATTLHSHGVRLDNAFDGIPDMTQKAIPVGGTFTYHLKFPDAGMYWYHPHVREDYAQEMGLYGNFLVSPQDTAFWPPANREAPLMLDDILIENGTVAPFAQNESSHTLMGRYGNVMLINGNTTYNLNANSGEVVRLFITNAANTRTFNLRIPGATMKLIGSDGGAYERPSFTDNVIISPSERAVVDVLFTSSGAHSLEHITPQQTYQLGTITVGITPASPSYQAQFTNPSINTNTQADLDKLRPLLTKAVDKSLSIGIAMGVMHNENHNQRHMMLNHLLGQQAHAQMSNPATNHSHHMTNDNPIEWEDDMAAMNAISDTQSIQWTLTDDTTGKSNMDIDWTFKQGDKVKIKITNSAHSMHPMQHPIHLHGQRFLITSVNGLPNDNLVWKDTALIQTGDTVELLVDMTNPGQWMLHCHIAEHLEDGMMLPFTVTP